MNVTSGPASRNPTLAELEEDTDAATRWGTEEHPDIYGGVNYTELDPPAAWELYVVLRSPGSIAAVERLRASLKYSEALTVKDTPRPASQLAALHERIADELEAGKFPGTMFSTIGTDITTGEVLVGIRPFSERAAEQIRSTYGPAVRASPGVEVHEVAGDAETTPQVM